MKGRSNQILHMRSVGVVPGGLHDSVKGSSSSLLEQMSKKALEHGGPSSKIVAVAQPLGQESIKAVEISAGGSSLEEVSCAYPGTGTAKETSTGVVAEISMERPVGEATECTAFESIGSKDLVAAQESSSSSTMIVAQHLERPKEEPRWETTSGSSSFAVMVAHRLERPTQDPEESKERSPFVGRAVPERSSPSVWS